MKFFTPKLFIQNNSSDEVVVDRAYEEWEANVEKYESYLKSVGRLPPDVKKLTALRLHDARILSRPKSSKGIAVLYVETRGTAHSLIYGVRDRVRVRAYPSAWPFSKEPEYWLYDELDGGEDGSGPWHHRILLSSGVELEIPFTSVIVQEIPLPRPAQKVLA